MGRSDMKQTDQFSSGEATNAHRKFEEPTHGDVALPSEKIASIEGKSANLLGSAVWSSDSLLSSSRLFQRSNSTPPTHVEVNDGRVRKRPDDCEVNHDPLGVVTVEENNQADHSPRVARPDLVIPMGKHMQRSWSAPPIPDSFDSFFVKRSPKRSDRSAGMLGYSGGSFRSIAENPRASWNDDGFDSDRSLEKTSIATISPLVSPSNVGGDTTSSSKASSAAPMGTFIGAKTRQVPPFRTLVDRVQEDFPRTPSPVFGYSADPKSQLADRLMSTGMKHLQIDQSVRQHTISPGEFHCQNEFIPVFQASVHDANIPQRGYNYQGYVSAYPVVPPPGFHIPPSRGVYGSALSNNSRSWARHQHLSNHSSRFPVAPADFDTRGHFGAPSFKGGLHGQQRFNVGFHGQSTATPSQLSSQCPQIYPAPMNYDMPEHHMYSVLQHDTTYRSRVSVSRRADFPLHSAHSYSSSSLLEEFKCSARADKWDLPMVQGHLAQFACDQAGSRFIQLKLEKADDFSREQAFNEVFPSALSLMENVFGNYVIQKFFDHGSVEQQRRLVGVMRKNMVDLALQVYGCRVIQKALEVCLVEEQLLLIRELRGHVLRCVLDQNGNHVLQKCIEAASWKAYMGSGGRDHVQGEDIQFIVDDFIGQAAALSMHAYGCRVIQRVLEHCSPHQIRPLVDEIVRECHELIKDQFGNYVIQHVICHGETEQRNTVLEVILTDVAMWSQHKYASNVVEACLDCASKQEINHIVELILDCDESGSSCALLPMMKHMYGNYVVQKLLDRADRKDRQRIIRIIQHNAEYLKRFTYGKHVLGRLERESLTGSGKYY